MNKIFYSDRNSVAIDIMTKMANFDFKDCYRRKVDFEDEGLTIPVLSLADLIAAKKVAKRHKDMDDIEHLEKDNI